MDAQTPISLTEVPRRLKTEHGTKVPYGRLYRAVISGDVPAERGAGGRWYVRPQDLPKIAEALGDPIAA